MKLKQEIDLWVSEGIITQEQSEKLYLRYGFSEKPVFYKESGFILKTISTLLLGLAFIIIIKENWESLPLLARSFIGLLPLSLVSLFTYRSILNKKDQSKNELFLFFGNLLIGVNIFLQAQIFEIHIASSFKLLIWSLVVLITNILLRSKLNLTFLILLFTVFHLNEFQEHDFYFLSIPIYLGSAYLIFLNMNQSNFLLGLFNLGLFNLGLFNLFLLGIAIHYMLHGSGLLPINLAYLQLGFTSSFVLSTLPWLYEKIDKNFLRRIQYFLFFFNLIFFCSLFIQNNEYETIFKNPPSITNMIYFLVSIFAYFMVKQNFFSTITLYIVSCAFILNLLAFTFHGGLDESLKPFIVFGISIASNIVFLFFCLRGIRYGLKNKIKAEFFTGVLMILLLIAVHYSNHADNVILTALGFLIFSGVIYSLNNLWNKKIMPINYEPEIHENH